MSTEATRVLLVEDDPDDVVLVRAALREATASTFDLIVAADASDATTHLRSDQFDVVLIDLSLPDAAGLESLSRIGPLARDTPIVVLTGLDDEGVALHAVQQGAQDYLVKGQATPDLMVRSIRYARERHRLIAERTRHIERELEAAALLQKTFLPTTVPTPANHDLGGHLHPSGQIGGDFYDFFGPAGEGIGVAVGDAAGKGIPGAILMAKAQGILRAEIASTLTPLSVVPRVNVALCRDRGQDRFVTLFYGLLGARSGRFSYVSAGHPRALLYRHDDVGLLPSTGPPLGLFAQATYEARTVTLGPGDRLVIYSDGVSEAQDGRDRFFDESGIHAVVAAHATSPARDLARLICDAAQRFEQSSPDPGDDKTVVVIRARETGQGPA